MVHFLHLFNYPAGHKWLEEILAGTEERRERERESDTMETDADREPAV